MRLIGLSGKARSGKDTLADELSGTFGWVKYSLATSLKKKAMTEFALSYNQVYGAEKDLLDSRYGQSPRSILIEMGKFYRSIDPNYWIKQLQKALLKARQAQLQTAVIADVRFPNEVEWIKSHGGFMVRLNRPIEMRGMELDDQSETGLDDCGRFDLIVPESRNVDMKDVPMLATFVRERVEGFYGEKVA